MITKTEQQPQVAEESTILILEDGRILARNVTRQLAGILARLNPNDADLASRAGLGKRNVELERVAI
jgi:hypothetical protein